MTTCTTSIATKELEVRYGKTVAVTDVNLDIPAGSLVSVIGPNGAGKSALLKALAGAIDIHSGDIDIPGPPPSFVMQSTEVDPSLPISVKDVVSLARYSNRGPFKRFRKLDRDAVDEAIERLNLKNLAKRQLHELSGGQRQRVGIARAIIKKPLLLLADEPVASLDPKGADLIISLLKKINQEYGTTILCNLHQVDLAKKYSDRVVGLVDGKVIFNENSSDIDKNYLEKIYA